MSSEILLSIDTVLKSLPPDVRPIVTGWVGELAATFTAAVIGGLSRALKREITRTPAENALKNAFEMGLTACVAKLAPPDTWREKRYRTALEYYLQQEEVVDEFAVLVDVRPDVGLCVSRLQLLFESDGRDLAQLPGLHFAEAMHAFAIAYCDAVERSGAQQHVDQLRHLKQIVSRLEDVRRETTLSRKELGRIREAIQMVEVALEQGLATQAHVFQEAVTIYRSMPVEATYAMQELSSRIAELSEAISSTVRKDVDTFCRADLETKEAAYCIFVASEFDRLDFRGMLQHGQPVTLPLERVYIRLRATQRVPTADTPEIDRLQRQLKQDEERQKAKQPALLNKEQRLELERQLEEHQRSLLQKQAEIVDLHRALVDRNNLGMVVLGDPGAGKTTLLRYLALVYAQNSAFVKLGLDEQRIPIFLPLAFYDAALSDDTDLSLSDYLSSYYASEKSLPGLMPLFNAALQEGRAVVLLDGLDEVLEAETRNQVGRRTEAFMRQMTGRGNRVILTSRIVGYRSVELPADIPHFTILDMDLTAVAAFVERWALALSCQVRGEQFDTPTAAARERADELATGLQRAIETSESVRRLAVNPLLLTILAVVYTQEGMALPRRRVELYDRYAHILIETWRRTRTAGRFVGKEMEFLATAKILGPLALWLQEEWPSGTAPGPLLREQLRHIFLGRLGWQSEQHVDDAVDTIARRKAEDFLADVREFAGVLIERGRDTYGFLHLTFQEYFAAWWLAKMNHAERLERLEPYLHDPRWREVVLLTAGHMGVIEGHERHVSEFVRAILSAHSTVPELHRDLLLAAACLSDDVGVHAQFERTIVDELAMVLRSSIPALALAAGQELGSMAETRCGNTAVDVALQVLHEKTEWWNRRAALLSLGRLRKISLRIIEALSDALADPVWLVRQAAVDSLGQLGQISPEIVGVLSTALQDRAWLVRQAAAREVVRLGQYSPEVINIMIDALVGDDVQVREVVADSLGELRQASSEIIEALLIALASDDVSVREAAAQSLGQLGQSSRPVVNALIVALADPFSSVREMAVQSLVQLGQHSNETIDALIDALHHSESSIREAVARSLVQLSQVSSRVVEAFTKALEHGDWQTRCAAAHSLIQLGYTETIALKTLERAFEDRAWLVRQAEAGGLEHLGQATPQAVHALVRLLNDVEDDVRQLAARSLGQARYPSPDVLSALLTALTDDAVDVRQAAAESLGQLSEATPRVIDALSAALHDRDLCVRQAVAGSLVRLGQVSPSTVEALESAVTHRYVGIRRAAASSLGHLSRATPRTITSLMRALADSDEDVQQAAAGSLIQLGAVSPAVLEALASALAVGDWRMRQAAAENLARLDQSSPEAVEALVTALSDTDPDVRDAAYQALLVLAPKAAHWVNASSNTEC